MIGHDVSIDVAELCHGCVKMARGGGCSIYAVPPKVYLTHKECPFNPKVVEVKKVKGRVGQQKQKRKGWRR